MAGLSRVSISDEKPLHMRLLSFPLMGYARTPFQSQTRSRSTCDVESDRAQYHIFSLQLHLEREELSLESSWEMSREPEPLRALLASMCHARSCNPSDWYPSSKARTAVG